MGEYLLTSLVFVFSAMVEFAFVIYLKQIQQWNNTSRRDGCESGKSDKMCNLEIIDGSNGSSTVQPGTRKNGIVQDTEDQKSNTISFWSRQLTILHSLPLTNKIDFAGFVLFYICYMIFNVVYLVRMD